MEKKQGFQVGYPLGLWPSIGGMPFAFDLAIVSKEWKGAGLTTVKPVRVWGKYIIRGEKRIGVTGTFLRSQPI